MSQKYLRAVNFNELPNLSHFTIDLDRIYYDWQTKIEKENLSIIDEYRIEQVMYGEELDIQEEEEQPTRETLEDLVDAVVEECKSLKSITLNVDDDGRMKRGIDRK